RPSAGHEAVEVGAADEGEAGAEGDRGDDVGPVHDAGVQGDLGVGAYLAHDLGQQVERDRGAVELAPAVVGQHDAVDPEVGQAPGVRDVLHALDHELAGPQLPDRGEVVVVDGGVHRRVQQLTDRAAGGGQRGELQLGGGEEVHPPPGPGHRVGHGAQRQLG